jgi:hypothetical protein
VQKQEKEQLVGARRYLGRTVVSFMEECPRVHVLKKENYGLLRILLKHVLCWQLSLQNGFKLGRKRQVRHGVSELLYRGCMIDWEYLERC